MTLTAIACLLLVAASSWLGDLLSSGEGRIATIWLANGFLVGVLLSFPRNYWGILLAAGFLGNSAASILIGRAYPEALAVSLFNSFEILLVCFSIRHFCGQRVDLSQWRSSKIFLIFGVFLGPLAGGLAASGYLQGIQSAPFESVLGTWFSAHALGTGIVTPLILVWIQEGLPPKRDAVRADWWPPLFLIVTTVSVFSLNIPSISFLVLLPLMIVVFRHGHFGAACGIGLVTAVAVPLTSLGHGPFALINLSGEREQVVLLQCFIAASSVLSLGAAIVLKQRSALLEKLVQTEKSLRTITDNVPALIAHVDARERFLFINNTPQNSYGLDPGIHTGLTVAECIGDAEYRSIKPQVDKVLSGERVDFEHVIPTEFGGLHHRVSYIPEFSPDGTVRGFYATTVDISSIRYAESQVEKSERWLRNVTDNVPGLIAYVGRNERIAFANRRFKEILGSEPEDLIGKSLVEYVGNELYQRISPHLQAVMRGEHVQFEQMLEYQGQKEHFLFEWVPDADPDGRVAGFFSAATNITNRKTSELRQAASEARIRTMTDGLPGLIAYLDRNGIIRFCNAAYEKWFGITPDQMIGKSMDEALSDILMQPQASFITQALEDQRVETEFEAEAKGRCRSLQATYLPHRDESGRVLGVYTLASDITPLKRMQGELQQMASYDTLTGLANRGQFNVRLAAALQHAADASEPLALMFIDVDRFKQVNDTYGHATGDAVLQEVAGRLKGCIGKNDMVARLSGDEFVILIENPKDAMSAQYVAREILSSMCAPVIFGDVEVTTGLSIGVAYNTPGATDAGLLLANADKALYQAKGAGRGTYSVFSEEASPAPENSSQRLS